MVNTGVSSNIEIMIETERLSDHFLMSPNDLHRGMGEWAGLTLRARALLAALLTTKSGWTTSRSAVDALAPELGVKGVTTVLNELKARRFLYTHRVNAGNGKFTWRWFVYLRPRAEGFSPMGAGSYPQALPSGHDGGDLRKQDVFPGRTILPSATDGQGQSIRSTSLLEVPEELTPPTPAVVAAGTAPVLAATEGEGSFARKTTTQIEERSESEGQLVLRDICHQMPSHLIPINGNRARLIVLASRALSSGWSRQALVDRIGGNGLEVLDNSGRVFGMLRYRLEHVGTPEDYRPVPSRPLVAGRTRHHRYVEDMAGYDQCAVCGMGRGNFRHSEDAPEIVPAEMEPGIVGDVSAKPNEAAVRSLVGAFRGLSM